jgi:uncharacterized Rossmann fold enzyme
MRFEAWERHYRRILADFGYDEREDVRAARILDRVLRGERIPLDRLEGMLREREVTVAGNGPNLAGEMDGIRGVLIAADEATSVLAEGRIRPDIVVTDLDGRVEDQIAANAAAAVAVIHAHGDNVPALQRWAPRFEGPVVASTQARPFGAVYNFGGFTDGDRGVFLADHFGAAAIRLVGFDFENPNAKDTSPEVKKRKLEWAHTLIRGLGRDELSGRG